MERTIISLDYAIKHILRDKANFDILSGFLTELLGREVTVQEILESEGNAEGLQGKVNRLDLKAKIDGGELAIFEFQFLDKIDFLGKVLFNACKAVVEQVSKGKYYDIRKVYSINVAYFDLGAQKEYVFYAGLTDFCGIHFDEKIPFSQNINPVFPANSIHPAYYLIFPDKFDEQIRSKFDEWVYVLKKSAVRSDFTAAGIQSAGEKLNFMKMTRTEQLEYEATVELEASRKTEFYTAEVKGKLKGKIEGLAEGEAIGFEKGLEDTVVKAFRKGHAIDNIADFTDLPEEQVIQILKKYGLIPS